MSIKFLERSSGNSVSGSGDRILLVPINDIHPGKTQPRRSFDEAELRSLARSIEQNGVLQPLTIRKTGVDYELIAGERRLRAARMAGLNHVPCIAVEADDNKSAVFSLIENLQREDLNFYDEALGIDRLIKLHGLTQEEAASRLGKSQSSIANKLRILRIPEGQLTRLAGGGFTERHARALVMVTDDKLREQLIEKIIKGRLTVAETEQLVEKSITPRSKRTVNAGAVKDLRIFLNTVTKALNAMRLSGLNATSTKKETDNYIEYTILIPKKTGSIDRLPRKIG